MSCEKQENKFQNILIIQLPPEFHVICFSHQNAFAAVLLCLELLKLSLFKQLLKFTASGVKLGLLQVPNLYIMCTKSILHFFCLCCCSKSSSACL